MAKARKPSPNGRHKNKTNSNVRRKITEANTRLIKKLKGE